VTRTSRALALLALAAPLAGVGVLAAAPPAVAGGGITSPGSGVTFTSDTTVRITASISGTTQVDLRLKSPAATSAQTVDSGQGTLTNSSATLSYDLDTSCATYPSSSCSGRAPARNGVWTISLSGGANDTRTFTLRIPPRTPTGLTASPDGSRAVVVSWRKGDEPDLTGWTLYGDGGVVQDGIGTDACSGTSCSTTVTYAADGTGTHTYSLSAHRSVAPGSSETLESARSGQVSATLAAPAPSPASGSGSGSGSSTGSTSGSGTGSTSGSGSTGTTGGTGTSGSGSTGSTSGGGSTGPSASASPSPGATAGSGPSGGGTTASGGSGGSEVGTSSSAPGIVAQRRQFALTFKAFSPKLGIPKLPPLPATATPAVAPLPDGTYEKTLGYKPVVTKEKVRVPQAVDSRVTGAVGTALDSSQFLRSVAGALVLLLAAAHLRRWLGAGHQE
jgi:hypothetical protein